MKTPDRITLVEAPHLRSMCETQMRYLVMLDGVKYDELYFNTKGYRGSLPTADGHSLNIGEKPISTYKREIARLNKEFRTGVSN